MGWDALFAGLLAGWIMERHERKKDQKTQLQQQYSSTRKGSVSERLFVSARNKQLTDSYENYCSNYKESSKIHSSITSLKDSDQEKLRYYYSRLEFNPASFDCRTELVHFILKLWRDEGNANAIDLLQNELIYMIDYMSTHTQEERMYQHLAMFLSAECYFLKGEFAKALKRLYQVLDWQEIYDNVDEKDCFDFNGLYSFHVATVANIINLYALAGIPEKTDAVREACKSLVDDFKGSHYNFLSEFGNNVDLRNFAQSEYNMMMAKNNLQGYYFFDDKSYKSNLFKESIINFVRGQAIYYIETLPCNNGNFSVINNQSSSNSNFINYNSLYVEGYGLVENYEVALDRDREIMRNI